MISKSRFIVWTSSLLIFYSIFFAINVQAITVTVNMAGSGSGTITSSPAGITCEKENKSCTYQSSNTTDVTLIATPDANNSFTSWTGCSSSTGDNCIVHMNQNQTITATFEPTSPTISQIQAKFAGLNLGIGLGAIYWVQNDVGVADAQVINGIVRVTKTNKSWAGIILESHYFFTPTWGNINKCKDGTDNCEKNFGFGPFIAVMPGTDNLIQSMGGGIMFGLKRQNSSNSFNLGLGGMINPNQQVLGDGLVENQPIPTNDQIRYKTVTAWGYILSCSFTF
jgi:hypothetical protein